MSTGVGPSWMRTTNAMGGDTLTKAPAAVYGMLGYPSSQQHAVKEGMHPSMNPITDQTGASRMEPEAYGTIHAENGWQAAHKRYGARGRRPREHIPRFIPPRMLRLQQQATLSFLGATNQVLASRAHSQQSTAHQSSGSSLDQYLQSIPAAAVDTVTAQSRVSEQKRSLPRYSEHYVAAAALTTQGPNGSAVPEPTWSVSRQPMPQVFAPHDAVHVSSTVAPRNSSKRRPDSNCAPVKLGQQGTPRRSHCTLAHRSQSPEHGLFTCWPPQLHARHATIFDPFGDRSEAEWLATAILAAAHERSSHPEASVQSAMSRSSTEEISPASNIAASASARNVKVSPLAMAPDVRLGQRTYGLALFPTSIWGMDGLEHADTRELFIINGGDAMDDVLQKKTQGPCGSKQAAWGIHRQEQRGGDRRAQTGRA
ncbi:hypothetical protein OE88DRAFT_1731878 [Heliocybe sulcata]|uniref:Uncharacterized protein n=1 Tax=Heliocybe sulcata TaxID=5364 RepID=A0A5C3NRD6_9AGAM|nr:hypothetical protein OE88DRAFT_1731878 [Heliocybe sulcata]